VAEPTRVGLHHFVRELRGGFVLLPGAITLAMALSPLRTALFPESLTEGLPCSP
jgi:hypothetical protein